MHYNKHEKAEICLKNNIDIMIEDSIETCINLINEGIETYTMNTRFNQNDLPLNRVSTWKEKYYKISSKYPKQEKTKNKCDSRYRYI